MAALLHLGAPASVDPHLVQALVAVPNLLRQEADGGAVAAALVVSGAVGGGTLVRQGGKQSACTWPSAWVPMLGGRLGKVECGGLNKQGGRIR